MAIYFCVLTALGIDRYAMYRSGVDLGLFVQAIADAAHGMHNQVEGVSHFLYHFSPVLIVFAPFLRLTHSPIALVAVQALAGAAVAPAIYLLARRRVDERLAAMAATVSLLYPPLVGVTFADFHENGLAPAALAWLVWAVDARRFGWAALVAAVAIGIKEDEALALGVLGIGYAVWSAYHKDRAAALFGAGVGVIGIAVFVAFFTIVRPLAGAAHGWTVLGYYLVDRPNEAQGWWAVYFRLSFLVEALGPLLFLPLRSSWFLLAVPGLIEVLVSRWSITYTMGQHYAGVWIAYVLAAYVCALAAIASRNPNRAETLAKVSMLVCVLILVFASPTHWGHFLGLPSQHVRALNRIVERVPSEAAVGTVDEVYSHLSLDPNARPGYAGNLEYLLVDGTYDSPTWDAIYRHQLVDQLRARTYQAIAREDEVTLYRLRK